ncbi:hypothetical protein J5X98_19250 [Leptothermofonsia sichuanensis E412]|uniref:hypothetical protein n=1 Tax=Leptothermofonsia sichuanensis TaxID=2917832 RepID=UPI001CA68FA8|nr:hypothetical protein [Leptothermofonsia sichuanensis]QZZ19483.1 hypothetical protein J5X98_19250 [Leptothermofonsia sichuanensis E412]
MNPNSQATFSGGSNIALKIPRFRFAETVAFYRDTLRLPYLGQRDTSYVFQFGTMRLWLDEVGASQLGNRQPSSPNPFSQKGRRGAGFSSPSPVLGEGFRVRVAFRGHWISDPAGVVHLLSHNEEVQLV